MLILLQVLRFVTSVEDQPFQISVYPVFKLATFPWTRPKLPLIGLVSLTRPKLPVIGLVSLTRPALLWLAKRNALAVFYTNDKSFHD